MNATAKLECGHVLPFKNWPAPFVPRLGERLWCWECRDERVVTEMETDEILGDKTNDKPDEYIWS